MSIILTSNVWYQFQKQASKWDHIVATIMLEPATIMLEPANLMLEPEPANLMLEPGHSIKLKF